MSATSPQQPMPISFEVTVPEALSAGVHANNFGTRFGPTDLTVDFLVNLFSEARTDDTGQAYLYAPARVVARVKLPPSLLFRLIEQLNAALTGHEEQFGVTEPLGPPIPPPADNVPPTTN